MSIFESLESIKDYLENKTGLKTYIGRKDFSPDEYPAIRIYSDETAAFIQMNTKAGTLNFNFKISIEAAAGNERVVFDGLEAVLKNINSFRSEEGTSISREIRMEYDADVYRAVITYNLKSILTGA
jgi:hypothetical protein